MKDDLLYVDHILECIRRIEEYTVGGKQALLTSTLVQDGVIRSLQILAESSKRISEAGRNRFPEIPWRQMAGFRNIAIHDYLYVDLEYVWEIVSLDLPELKTQMNSFREKLVGGR